MLSITAAAIALTVASAPTLSVAKFQNDAKLKSDALELIVEQLSAAALAAEKAGRVQVVKEPTGELVLNVKLTTLDKAYFATLKVSRTADGSVVATKTVSAESASKLVNKLESVATELFTSLPQSQAPQATIEESCEQQPRACAKRAREVQKTAKTAADYQEAMRLYGIACEAGDYLACGVLGEMHEKGDGTPVNLKEAERLYVVACTNKYAGACISLGDMLQSTDKERALKDYQYACEFGEGLGCTRAGWMREQLAPKLGFVGGFDIEKPRKRQKALAEAASFFARGCELNEPSSCGNLANYYEQGMGVAQDWNQAEYYYGRSCELQKGPACGNKERVRRALDAEGKTINVNINR